MKITLGLFLIIFFIAGIGSTLFFMAKLRDARADINSPAFQDKLDSVGLPPTRILTADGVELYRISSENRQPILDINDVPLKVREAFLAAEDKRFYEHQGVDVQGLARAVSTLKDGKMSQGGSTLTMQLSKLLFTSTDKSASRKLQDIAYALALEESKSKDQILLLYLNKVFFGETAHGLKAAAQVYFDKNFQDLTVGEAAMLARCVQLPSRYNPIKTPKRALENRNLVLKTMREQNWLTENEYKKALAEVPKINKNPPKTTASRAEFGQHFVEHVLQTLDDDAPEIDYRQGGYVIYTTLNSKLQKLAEQQVRQVVSDSRRQRVNQGAFVMMNRDGEILCEVGGVDFKKSQYNIISQGKRQPGSSFKGIVYATAFSTGELSGPNDSVSNAPIHQYDPWTKKTWSPENASRRENNGSYSVRTAFAASINRPAIHTLLDIGPKTVIQYARDVFGIQSDLFAGGPLALGASEVRPLEMLRAYSVFMSHGDRIEPQPIDRIVGTDGDVVKRFLPKKYVSVLTPQVCDMMDVLTEAVCHRGGTAPMASAVPNAHGKTGTTNAAKDAWFCGYTDGLVAVAWVGNEQVIKGVPHALPMASSVFGGTVAAKIWTGVLTRAYDEFHQDSPDSRPSDESLRVASKRRPERDVEAIKKDDEIPVDITVPDDNNPDDPVENAPKPDSTTPDPAEDAPPIPPDTSKEDDQRRREQEKQLRISKRNWIAFLLKNASEIDSARPIADAATVKVKW